MSETEAMLMATDAWQAREGTPMPRTVHIIAREAYRIGAQADRGSPPSEEARPAQVAMRVYRDFMAQHHFGMLDETSHKLAELAAAIVDALRAIAGVRASPPEPSEQKILALAMRHLRTVEGAAIVGWEQFAASLRVSEPDPLAKHLAECPECRELNEASLNPHAIDRASPPEPSEAVLEQIVGEALYFEYPAEPPPLGDVQRKRVREAVAKIQTALRASDRAAPSEPPPDEIGWESALVKIIHNRQGERGPCTTGPGCDCLECLAAKLLRQMRASRSEAGATPETDESLDLRDDWERLVTENAALRRALQQRAAPDTGEGDPLRKALEEIESYARTSYAEAAMRERIGDKRLMEVVNIARRALRSAPAQEAPTDLPDVDLVVKNGEGGAHLERMHDRHVWLGMGDYHIDLTSDAPIHVNVLGTAPEREKAP